MLTLGVCSSQIPETDQSRIDSAIIDLTKKFIPAALTPSPLVISESKAELKFSQKGNRGNISISVEHFSSPDKATEKLRKAGELNAFLITPIKDYIGEEAISVQFTSETGSINKGGWIKYRIGTTIVTVYSTVISFNDVENIAKTLEPETGKFKFNITKKSTALDLKEKHTTLDYNYYDISDDIFKKMNMKDRINYLQKELSLINAAVEQHALEKGLSTGSSVHWNDIQVYLNPRSRLHKAASDPMGIKYPEKFTVGTPLELEMRLKKE